MEKVDQAYLDEILKTKGSTEDGKSVNDVKVEDEGTSIEEIKVSIWNVFSKFLIALVHYKSQYVTSFLLPN